MWILQSFFTMLIAVAGPDSAEVIVEVEEMLACFNQV